MVLEPVSKQLDILCQYYFPFHTPVALFKSIPAGWALTTSSQDRKATKIFSLQIKKDNKQQQSGTTLGWQRELQLHSQSRGY